MAAVRRQIRTVQTTAAVGVMAAVLTGVVWLFWPASHRRLVIAPELAAVKPVLLDDGLVLKPVDMPMALLFDCYENALENVPPRTDTSKRQWNWEAPPLPMDLARRELGRPDANENDRKILAWLDHWEEGWLKDYPTTTDQLWELDACSRCGGTSDNPGSFCIAASGICTQSLDAEGSPIPIYCGDQWRRMCEWNGPLNTCACPENGGERSYECEFFECDLLAQGHR